jgi:hypothetical protein
VSVPFLLHRLSVPAAVVAFAAALSLLAPAARADVPPANIGRPTITTPVPDPQQCPENIACVGDTATGTRGTWTDESSLTFHYEWQLCDNAVACTLLSSFDGNDPAAQPVVITPDMVGRGLRFRVYATGPGGTTIATSDVVGPFGRSPATVPVVQTAPSIELADSDRPLSGQTLIGRIGVWDDAYRDYQYVAAWLRCESNGMNCRQINYRLLDGPNDPVSYRMTPSDVGYVIRLEVDAHSSAGTRPELTAPTDLVGDGGPPVNLQAPLLLVGSYGTPARPVSGPVSPGDTLTATPGSWTVNDNLIVSWLRCDRSGASCASIPGADAQPGQSTRLSYIVSASDAGSSIRADVTASAFLGSSTLRTVAARVGPDPATGTGSGSGTGTSTGSKDRATVRVRSAKVTGSGKTLAVYLSLGAAGKVSISAKGGGTTLGKVTRELGKGRVAIAVTLSKKARKMLAGGKKLKTTLSLSLRTAEAGRGSLTQSVTLRGAAR